MKLLIEWERHKGAWRGYFGHWRCDVWRHSSKTWEAIVYRINRGNLIQRATFTGNKSMKTARRHCAAYVGANG